MQGAPEQGREGGRSASPSGELELDDIIDLLDKLKPLRAELAPKNRGLLLRWFENKDPEGRWRHERGFTKGIFRAKLEELAVTRDELRAFVTAAAADDEIVGQHANKNWRWEFPLCGTCDPWRLERFIAAHRSKVVKARAREEAPKAIVASSMPAAQMAAAAGAFLSGGQAAPVSRRHGAPSRR